MSASREERLLEFLEGTLEEDERAKVLQQLEVDPELAAELERAAMGLEALRAMPVDVGTTERPRRSSLWRLAFAVVATLVIAIPATWFVASNKPEVTLPTVNTDPAAAPEFVLVLRGHWIDDVQLDPEEFQQRIADLRQWTAQLTAGGVLVSATDLAIEQGVRYGASDSPGVEQARQAQDPDYVVGVLTLRMDEYHEALAVARSCPHLQYGGSVTVRRVGSGFFTISGRRDFTE